MWKIIALLPHELIFILVSILAFATILNEIVFSGNFALFFMKELIFHYVQEKIITVLPYNFYAILATIAFIITIILLILMIIYFTKPILRKIARLNLYIQIILTTIYLHICYIYSFNKAITTLFSKK